MRKTVSILALLGAAVVPMACGGSPQATAQNPSLVATGSDPVGGERTDLTPVTEPEGVVAIARWKNPRRGLDTLQQWLGIPLPVNEALDEVLDVPGAGNTIDFEAPVDALIALDPQGSTQSFKPFAAFSIGFRSLNDAHQALSSSFELQEIRPGVFRLNLDRKLPCMLSASIGPSPARMVCAKGDRDLDALQPFMTRGLPSVVLPDSDLHGQFRFESIRAKYGSMLPNSLEMATALLKHELGTGDRNLDRAITDASTDLSKEILDLINDFDGLSIDVRLDPQTRTMSSDMTLLFRSRTSWMSQRFFDGKTESGPPEIFWNIPSASTMASYGHGGGDTNAFSPIKRHGVALIDAALAMQNLPAADRKALVEVYERMFDGGPTKIGPAHVYATGPNPTKKSAVSSENANVLDEFKASFGWQLMGFEEPAAQLDGWLQQVTRAYGRAGFQKWLRKEASIEARDMPRVRYGARMVAGLPGLKAMQITVPAKVLDGYEKPGASSLELFVMLVPDGQRCWFAVGADAAVLEKNLKTAKTGGEGTLRNRTDLAPLRSTRTRAGGYLTMAGLVSESLKGMADPLGRKRFGFGITHELFDKIPNHGETPILFYSQTQDGTPAKSSVKFHVDRGTIDDLRALVQSLGLQP